jgi:hypothetical protein
MSALYNEFILKQDVQGGDWPHTDTAPVTPRQAASAAVVSSTTAPQQQQQQRALDERDTAAMSCDASSDAPQGDVAADVSDWQLLVDTRDFLNEQLLPRLKAGKPRKDQLKDVGDVLTELQTLTEQSDEHDSRCAQRLKLSLQQFDANKTEQQTDANVLLQWTRQQCKLGSQGHRQLARVS